MIIAGTGHRPNKLGGYDSQTFARLINLADKTLDKYQPDVVISGMALGWDQALAAAALSQSIPYHTYIPFEGQECKWPEHSQKYYRWLRDHAAHEIIVCSGGYAAHKMQFRNEAMVDTCDTLLALWDGTPGGTGNCMQYAKKKLREDQIHNLWNCWLKYK